MSMKLEGEKCPVCHAYLFEDEDVVYCPECGAPHHRDCYMSIGRCGLSELHGTDRQYDIVKAAEAEKEPEPIEPAEAPPAQDTGAEKCRMCGEEYEKDARACPKCGAPNVAAMNGFANYDFLGGIPADMDIGDGVTADEAKRFVAANTPRYIPKFAAMKMGKRASWNWLAFLFPCGWFLSRKMYLNGILAGLFTVAATLLQIPLAVAIDGLGMAENATYAQIAQTVSENIGNIGVWVILAAGVSMVTDLIIRVIVGAFGDWWYRGYTVSTIKKMRSESEDIDEDYRRYGGVNIWAMMIGLMAVQYMPMLISFLL